MYITKDRCAQCLNIDNCEHRGKYVCSLFKLTEFLSANKKDVEWFKIVKEELCIDADLEAADAYAKEHNLKWGIIYE